MAGGLIDPRDEIAAIILLNGHSTKFCLNLHFYTHRLVQFSDLIREGSLCSAWQLMQKLTPGQSTENK